MLLGALRDATELGAEALPQASLMWFPARFPPCRVVCGGVKRETFFFTASDRNNTFGQGLLLCFLVLFTGCFMYKVQQMSRRGQSVFWWEGRIDRVSVDFKGRSLRTPHGF